MAPLPLQAGSRVSLKKKAWQHVVGIIQRPVGDGQFLVNWDVPVGGATLPSGTFKRAQLKRVSPIAPGLASAPACSPAIARGHVGLAQGGNSEFGDDDDLLATSVNSNSTSTSDLIALLNANPRRHNSSDDDDTAASLLSAELVELDEAARENGIAIFGTEEIDTEDLLEDELPDVVTYGEIQARRDAQYHDAFEKVNAEKRQLLTEGFSLQVRKGGSSNGPVFEWKMIADHAPRIFFEDYVDVGIAGFDLPNIKLRNFPILDLFEHLFPVSIQRQLNVMNLKIKS